MIPQVGGYLIIWALDQLYNVFGSGNKEERLARLNQRLKEVQASVPRENHLQPLRETVFTGQKAEAGQGPQPKSSGHIKCTAAQMLQFVLLSRDILGPFVREWRQKNPGKAMPHWDNWNQHIDYLLAMLAE